MGEIARLHDPRVLPLSSFPPEGCTRAPDSDHHSTANTCNDTRAYVRETKGNIFCGMAQQQVLDHISTMADTDTSCWYVVEHFISTMADTDTWP